MKPYQKLEEIPAIFGTRFLAPMPDDHIGGAIAENGVREFQETALIIGECSEARTFVDVGANIGWYSVLVPKYHHQIRCAAIEPHPETAEILRRNLALNGISDRVDVLELGTSDINSEMEIYEHHESLGGSQFWPHDDWPSVKSNVQRLDTCLPPLMDKWGVEKIDLMKIEVQGYEVKTLRGLGKIPVDQMFIVYSPNMLLGAGDSGDDLRGLLESRFKKIERVHRHAGLREWNWDLEYQDEPIWVFCDLRCSEPR